MNLSDLAALLQDKNITVNIQGGAGNTMYTGPAQVNNYNAPIHVDNRRIETSEYMFRCRSCGHASTYHEDFIAQGSDDNRWYLCEPCNDERVIGAEIQQWRDERRLAIPEPTPEQRARWYKRLEPGEKYQAPQLFATDEQGREYLETIYDDPQYARNDRDRRSARERYLEAERANIARCQAEWEARHPRTRMVAPLPAEMCLQYNPQELTPDEMYRQRVMDWMADNA